MKLKEKIIESLYKIIKTPYQHFYKESRPWEITTGELLSYPPQTLGFELGSFLRDNLFEMQPGLEEHDVFHVLTQTGTTVKDEIDMQFYLLGNGKRSPFVFIVVFTGLLFYPFQITSFIERFRKGKQAHHFWHLDFYKMLSLRVEKIQNSFNIR